jgi:hypothetical protein
MFEDVPPLLTAFVEATLDPERADYRYALAASLVTAFYLKEPVERSREGQKFFRLEMTPSGYVSPHFFAKSIVVGETLFLLRNCVGFEELCRKLETGDLEAQYFELLTARLFRDAGFEISARVQTWIKKEDFDFNATRAGEIVNVEATRIGNAQFSTSTIRNRLKKKRTQLPKNFPSVIFCEHPSEWSAQVPNLAAALGEITVDFFRNTERVNAVVYMVQEYSGYSETYGALSASSLAFFNEAPQHTFSDWRFLREGQFHHNIGPSPELTAFARGSEFYAWVDHITRKLKNGG